MNDWLSFVRVVKTHLVLNSNRTQIDFTVGIELDFVFVWVDEIELILLWGIELDLVSFGVGIGIDLVVVWGSKMIWFQSLD